MRCRQYFGQNMMEFAIILGLVVVCGIAAFALLGDNIVAMFSASNASVEDFDPFNVKVTGGNANNANNPTPTPPPGPGPVDLEETKDVGGTTVHIFSDGSAQLAFSDSTVTLSSDIVEGLNEVFETSGSNGIKTYVVQAIESMIQDHKAEHPEGVPLEMAFGDGNRTEPDQGDESCILFFCSSDDAHVSGKTKLVTLEDGSTVEVPNSNTITLKVGDHLKIIQKDQSGYSDSFGTFMIDGNIEGSKFVGALKKLAGSNNYIQNDWDFVSSYSSDADGILLDGEMIEGYGTKESCFIWCSGGPEEMGNWDISFSDFYSVGMTTPSAT